jgi:hypothetical protein
MKKIITLSGGLGNQLFQYAHGRKLQIIDKKDIIFDISFFENSNTNSRSKIDTPRPFLLPQFNINPDAIFTTTKQNHITKFIQKIISKITGNYHFYQSEKYFTPIKEAILKEFTLKNPLTEKAQEFLNTIKDTSNSISVHIRRGDYAYDAKTHNHHGLCDLDYYYKAIDLIKSKIDNPLFFIFSDDIEWVKNNLKIENGIFISNPNIREYEEMFIMSQCSHNIIANSTFSWWAAYINQNHNKTVIAPKQWTVRDSSDKIEILPTSWIQI